MEILYGPWVVDTTLLGISMFVRTFCEYLVDLEIIPSYEEELLTENCSKDEVQNMVFSELYTKARSIAGALGRCEVNARILDSEGLIDLLYVAYNRDESDVFGAKRAMKAGFEEIYTTAPDVFERKLKILDKQIEG